MEDQKEMMHADEKEDEILLEDEEELWSAKEGTKENLSGKEGASKDRILKACPEENENGQRIDRYLAVQFPVYSRSFYQKLLDEGVVCVNGKSVKRSYKIQAGEEILVQLPEPKELHVEPEDIPLDILYEDEDILVINKPKGMVVHPAPGHESHTVVNAVLYHCKDQLSGINGVMRPGIVHRIDKDTSGVIVICKNDQAHLSLAAQLRVHSITRKYEAIVCGNIRQDEGTIDVPIGRSTSDRKKMAVNVRNGRDAVTHYHVLERFGDYTYVECTLETGRTHQIRVHMSYMGHPVLGDAVYGPKDKKYHTQGQTLHAKVLGFMHPSTGEYMEFTAPLPDYFERLLTLFRKG